MCIPPNRPDPARALAVLAETEAHIAAMSTRVRVSIDQCFLLDMVEGVPAAVALHDALQAAIRRGRVLCPIHPEESVFESSLFRPELRRRVFDLQRSLAGGFCFHSFGERMQREVTCFLLERTLPPIWPRPFNPPDGEVEALSGANRTGRNEYQERLDAVVPSETLHTHSFERILADLTQHHNQSMLRVIRAIEHNQPLPVAPATWEYAVAIGARLRQIGVIRSDLARFREWVESGGWHQSADLTAFTRLWAAVEREGLRNNRRTRANDLLDILRIAVAFADAQAVFCDKAMASFIRQAGLHQALPGRQVFGMGDMNTAAAYLAAL